MQRAPRGATQSSAGGSAAGGDTVSSTGTFVVHDSLDQAGAARESAAYAAAAAAAAARGSSVGGTIGPAWGHSARSTDSLESSEPQHPPPAVPVRRAPSPPVSARDGSPRRVPPRAAAAAAGLVARVPSRSTLGPRARSTTPDGPAAAGGSARKRESSAGRHAAEEEAYRAWAEEALELEPGTAERLMATAEATPALPLPLLRAADVPLLALLCADGAAAGDEGDSALETAAADADEKEAMRAVAEMCAKCKLLLDPELPEATAEALRGNAVLMNLARAYAFRSASATAAAVTGTPRDVAEQKAAANALAEALKALLPLP